MISATKAINALTQNLEARQKDVISGRFGFSGVKEGKTLAEIGDGLGVTRERIRQIEAVALQTLRDKIKAIPACLQILEKGKKYLKSVGGISKREKFLEYAKSFTEDLNDNHVALLIEVLPEFQHYKEDENFWPFYYLTEFDLKNCLGFIDGWLGFLDNNKEKVLDGAYKSLLDDFIKSKKIDPAHAKNILAISKKIHSNPYGDVGVRDWPEINPATTRDRAYLVLKKKKKPLHFTEIAKVINSTGFGAQLALAPTVHNELIKDSRFVLVGRGLYALREHGFEPGVAREVIHKILKKQGPLTSEKVIEHVNKQRFFKPNTILINLQNKAFFERSSDGTYRVRQA